MVALWSCAKCSAAKDAAWKPARMVLEKIIERGIEMGTYVHWKTGAWPFNQVGTSDSERQQREGCKENSFNTKVFWKPMFQKMRPTLPKILLWVQAREKKNDCPAQIERTCYANL